MLKPIEKPVRKPLVHHPCDKLDAFCQYDGTNLRWLEFSESVSEQLLQFEEDHPEYLRSWARLQMSRRREA